MGSEHPLNQLIFDNVELSTDLYESLRIDWDSAIIKQFQDIMQGRHEMIRFMVNQATAPTMYASRK
jgi:hypothetical protein